MGLNFDFGNMLLFGHPELWQIDTLSNVAKQNLVIQQLRQISNENGHVKTNYLEVMQKILGEAIATKSSEPFEDCESLLRRATVIKSFLKEYLRCNKLKGQ